MYTTLRTAITAALEDLIMRMTTEEAEALVHRIIRDSHQAEQFVRPQRAHLYVVT